MEAELYFRGQFKRNVECQSQLPTLYMFLGRPRSWIQSPLNPVMLFGFSFFFKEFFVIERSFSRGIWAWSNGYNKMRSIYKIYLLNATRIIVIDMI